MILPAKAAQFRCHHCAAQVTWDPRTRQLKCAHCGSLREVELEGHAAIVAHDLAGGLAAAPRGWGAALKVHRCQECGADVAFADRATATRCAFCGSGKVLDEEELRNPLRPESLVPFAVDQPAAGAAFTRWLGRLWLRPGDLRRLADLAELQGVYIPFWAFDVEVHSRWRAERGHHEQEPRFRIQGGRSLGRAKPARRTRWVAAFGAREDLFRDHLVCASKGLPPSLARRIASLDGAPLYPYAPGYLAGFQAEEYALDLQEAWSTARSRIELTQRQRCAAAVGGDTHRRLTVEHRFARTAFKHTLLPVWIAAYRYRGRIYRFLVDGHTGRVAGRAPWSVIKVTFALLLLSVLIAALFLLSRR